MDTLNPIRRVEQQRTAKEVPHSKRHQHQAMWDNTHAHTHGIRTPLVPGIWMRDPKNPRAGIPVPGPTPPATGPTILCIRVSKAPTDHAPSLQPARHYMLPAQFGGGALLESLESHPAHSYSSKDLHLGAKSPYRQKTHITPVWSPFHIIPINRVRVLF